MKEEPKYLIERVRASQMKGTLVVSSSIFVLASGNANASYTEGFSGFLVIMFEIPVFIVLLLSVGYLRHKKTFKKVGSLIGLVLINLFFMLLSLAVGGGETTSAAIIGVSWLIVGTISFLMGYSQFYELKREKKT